jgi:hypothetical protein
MKRIVICLLVLFVTNILQAAPVYIPDPNLKAAIEAQLGPNPDANQMLLLTELNANSMGVSNLTGLENATNLVKLKLYDNKITNINPLQYLTKLQYLYLSYNTHIADINAVSGMSSLIELTLTDVNLSTITPLADVNQISGLWLGSNQIEDINALTNYQNLTRLNLASNPLNSTSRCYYLQEIIANNSGNPGFSVTPSGFGDIDTASTSLPDLQIFVAWWLNQTCGIGNHYCYCADFDDDGRVDFVDFALFAEIWIGM